MLKRELEHRKVRKTFQQNPGPILIKIYNEEANAIQMEARDKETRNDIRHCRDQMIVKEAQVAHASVKEVTRDTDAEDEKDEHIRQKFKERDELVDKEARLITNKMKMKASAIKCYRG